MRLCDPMPASPTGGAILAGFLIAASGCAAPAREDARAERAVPPPSAVVPATAALVAGSPSSPTDTVPSRTASFGPYTIGGVRYLVHVERFLASPPDSGTRRVQVLDAAGRVIYDEVVASPDSSSGGESWVAVEPSPMRDSTGTTVAVVLGYGYYPSAPGSGEFMRILVPRGGVMRSLTPPIGYYGEDGERPDSAFHEYRALQGTPHILPRLFSGSYRAVAAVRFDLACVPDAPECARIVTLDTVGGLARVPVDASPRAIEDTGSVELFARPGAGAGERVRTGPATRVEVLDGAARLTWSRSGGFLMLQGDDHWLHVRVNGREGWVHEKFTALGLPDFG